MKGLASRTLLTAVISLLPAGPALAEADVLSVWPATDPTDFGSVWLDPASAATPPPGEWIFSINVAYFNSFRESGEVGALREESGIRGRVASEELREVELRFPSRDLFLIDMEGVVTEVRASRSLTASLSAWVRVPVISVGSPNWDSAAEFAHDTFGVGTKGRDLYPRGETLLYLRAGGSSLPGSADLETSRLGDLEAGVTWRRGAHRVLLSGDGSTADGRLGSSGGMDAALGYFYLRELGEVSLALGAGYARLDPAGSFLGIERSDTWHMIGRAGIPVWREISFLAGARIDSSPLADASSGDLGEPGLTIDLAVSGELGPIRGALHFLEDFPSIGVSADWSFLLTVTYPR